MPINLNKLDSFTESYLETALWSSTDHTSDIPLDDVYGIDDIHESGDDGKLYIS